MARNGATIRDVARRAGVSVGTASKALNGKGLLARETRERVRRAAVSLNYTPNALIRSLQRGSTHIVGVFLWRVDRLAMFTVGLRLMDGLSDGIGAIEHDMLLYSRYPHEGDVTVSLFLDGRVDGAILAPGGLSRKALQELGASGLPTVALYQGPPPSGVASVNIADASGISAAIRHLAEQGHRRIAWMGPNFSYDYNQRLTGYRQGVRDAGLDDDPPLTIVTDGLWPFNPVDPVDRLIALTPPATAIIAGDDAIAISIRHELQQRGFRVPADYSLIGFDDAPAAGNAPGLTTIRQPAEDLGRTAAAFILAMIHGTMPEDCRAVLPVELIVRSSTAPPASTSR